jgi:hypothetical protein
MRNAKSSGLLRVLQGLWIVLVLLTCVRVWVAPEPILPQARAQIPDPAVQRNQALVEARRTNQLLEKLINTLETRTLNVRIEDADNSSGESALPRRGGADGSSSR